MRARNLYFRVPVTFRVVFGTEKDGLAFSSNIFGVFAKGEVTGSICSFLFENKNLVFV